MVYLLVSRTWVITEPPRYFGVACRLVLNMVSCVGTGGSWVVTRDYRVGIGCWVSSYREVGWSTIVVSRIERG